MSVNPHAYSLLLLVILVSWVVHTAVGSTGNSKTKHGHHLTLFMFLGLLLFIPYMFATTGILYEVDKSKFFIESTCNGAYSEGCTITGDFMLLYFASGIVLYFCTYIAGVATNEVMFDDSD